LFTLGRSPIENRSDVGCDAVRKSRHDRNKYGFYSFSAGMNWLKGAATHAFACPATRSNDDVE
jgi:hypothetical protein